jgi:hypothetical protein
MFRQALPFLVAAALLAGAPALAAGTRSANLECVVGETDPDYGAWGVMKVASVQYLWTDAYGSLYRAKVNVACRNLTPGATYYTGFGSFRASGSGGGSTGDEVVFYYDGFFGGGGIGVMVEREDGVYVLAGYVPLSLP